VCVCARACVRACVIECVSYWLCVHACWNNCVFVSRRESLHNFRRVILDSTASTRPRSRTSWTSLESRIFDPTGHKRRRTRHRWVLMCIRRREATPRYSSPPSHSPSPPSRPCSNRCPVLCRHKNMHILRCVFGAGPANDSFVFPQIGWLYINTYWSYIDRWANAAPISIYYLYIDSNRSSICPAIDILSIFIVIKSSYLWYFASGLQMSPIWWPLHWFHS
jgi:hypothetical protein